MALQWQWLLDVGAWFWGRSKQKRIDQAHTILIVEDNSDDAELLSFCLKKHGLKGTITDTALGAIALIERNNIAIAFIDLRLKFMPGWELIPIIRRRSPHTLIVVICGHISDIENIHEDVWPLIVMSKPPSVEGIERLVSHLKI